MHSSHLHLPLGPTCHSSSKTGERTRGREPSHILSIGEQEPWHHMGGAEQEARLPWRSWGPAAATALSPAGLGSQEPGDQVSGAASIKARPPGPRALLRLCQPPPCGCPAPARGPCCSAQVTHGHQPLSWAPRSAKRLCTVCLLLTWASWVTACKALPSYRMPGSPLGWRRRGQTGMAMSLC